MILDAAEHVPFYRRHWAQAGVDLTRVYSAVHLEFLPVVRRADLAACPPEERLDRRFLGRDIVGREIAGANGQAFQMPVDARTLRRRRKRFVRALRDVGYSPGDRLMLLSTPPFPAGAALLRWTYADVRLGEEAVLAKFARARPHVIHGPLSTLIALGRRLLASAEVTWRPRLVISTSEPLPDSKRVLLESAFSAKVADFYSTAELGLIGYSKPGYPGYRMLTEEFHFELLPAAPGKRGGVERLLVTDLMGGALPLIRFDTGDLVRRDPVREGALTSALDAAPIVGIAGRAADCPKPASGPRLSPEEVPVTLDHIDGISMA
jgi:phenylacetate-CoA ligase